MLVSVVMSVYNSEGFLADSINSILNQTFKDFEFIIIDDGSNDTSVDIIESFLKDSRITFIRNEANLGLAASLNKGILAAQGKYIARQDADDISSLDRLEKQLKYATENEALDLIGTDCYVIDILGQEIYKSSNQLKSANYVDRILNRKGLFPHGSAFIKRSKLIEVGLYDTRFYYVQDGELWLRFLSNGAHVSIMSEPLYFFRLGPISNAKRGLAKIMFNKILKLKYLDNKNSDVISDELTKVQYFLRNSVAKSNSYYKSEYWKSLANASYLNGTKVLVTYKYLLKAFLEKNALIDYPKYLFLAIIYLLPSEMVRKVLVTVNRNKS